MRHAHAAQIAPGTTCRGEPLASQIGTLTASPTGRSRTASDTDALQLFHQENRPAALDFTGDSAVQLRGHARDATGENLAALGDKFFQEIRVLVVDRFDGDVDPAARHGTIGAAEGGTAFGGFGLHGELLRFAMKRVPF